jgi:hypothetical protein
MAGFFMRGRMAGMNEDPAEELKRGRKAARAVVAHLRRMGAYEATLKVSLKGRDYAVTVKRLAHGKKQEPPENNSPSAH